MSEKKYPEYIIIKDKILGKGDFSTVYLGRRIVLEDEKIQKNNENKIETHNNINRIIIEEEVAFKELTNEFKDDNEKLDSIQNEINISSTLDNTNIVKMINIVDKENKKYLVYEIFNGGDLRRYMDYFGRFDEELIRIIVIKMINALFELHRKNVIHHDIKPENILIQFFPREKTLVDNEIIKKIKLITKNKKQIQNNNNQNNHNQNNNNQNNNCIQNNPYISLNHLHYILHKLNIFYFLVLQYQSFLQY